LNEEPSRNTWARILGRIESKVNPTSFNTWFKPTQFLAEDAHSLRVQVPNDWYAEWLSTNYSALIRDVLREVDRPEVQVAFLPEGSVASAPAVEDAQARVPTMPGPGLDLRYTFDSFVVSSCNQFAHAAAMAVAEQPMRAYNPLYIHGGVGLGKTHLMQAIGNRVNATAKLRMLYISSEHFMNDLINSIRFKRTQEFKERYRKVDLLLIDDIQFLAGKERTQEEFFHTFNVLYGQQKQIVLTSDVHPREIPTLEERLRSRFEWGLIADIQPPDVETKVAILRKKAEAEGCDLAHDVALFVASKCNSNIRELEGALIRVMAYASVAEREIDMELAREALRNYMASQLPALTTDSIQKLVANHFKLKVADLKSKNNSRQVAFPRQVAMYLCKQLTSCSLPEIGRRFGGKHHSTVIHSIRKIERLRSADNEFDRMVRQQFLQQLK
jgi:chromosomal replication initiator protein